MSDGGIWPFLVANIGLALLSVGWLLLDFNRERLAHIYLKVGGGISLSAAVAIAAYGWGTGWVIGGFCFACFVPKAISPVLHKLEDDNSRLKLKFLPLWILSILLGGPVYVGLAVLVVLGIPFCFGKWLGFWGSVQVVLLIVGAFLLHSALFEKNDRP